MAYNNFTKDNLGSPIGHQRCRKCRDTPSHKIEPCGHYTCELHYQHEQDHPSCGHCGTAVYDFVKLPIASPIVGANNNIRKDSPYKPETPSPLHNMQNANSTSTSSSGHDSGITSSLGNNKFNMLASPTPGRYGASNNGGSNIGGSMSQAPPYVPPQRRADPIPRPDSRASTATFASQVTIEQSSFVSPSGSGSGSDPFVSPAGPYRFGQSDIPRHMSQLNLYSHEQHSPQPRFQFKNNNTMRPPTMNSGMLNNSGRGIHLKPGTEAHAKRAAELAAMIKAGGTEDPRDPDYGNPGPSRRPGAVTKSPVVKPKRGDIVAGAGEGNTPSPRQSSKEEPNTNGSAAAFLNTIKLPLPPWFDKVEQGHMPTFEEFMSVVPLVHACGVARPNTAGVVHIINLPYSTSRSEVIAMLGSKAKIIAQPPGSPFHAVHIVMERQTGKTMDAFVEVETTREARLIVTQFANRAAANRQAKLGDRAVEVNLSNRDEMLATLFQGAKNVTWVDGVPKISDRIEFWYPGVRSTGFIGFLQEEEITHMLKHAEMPQRSPYATRCLIRTYECLITTIHKYPWFATECILEDERVRLFQCVRKSVRALINMLSKVHGNARADPTKPTVSTLKELTVAVFTCPGFAEKEKAQVVADLRSSGYHQLTETHGMNLRFGGRNTFAADWPFRVAAKHPNASDQVMELFAAILRDATRDQVSVNDLFAAQPGAISSNFGAVNIDYSGAKTYADAYNIEVRAVHNLIARVLPRAGSDAGGTHTGSHHS